MSFVTIHVVHGEDRYEAQVNPKAEYDEVLTALIRELHLDPSQSYELEMTGALSLCTGVTIRVRKQLR
jgi:hypothetical protein